MNWKKKNLPLCGLKSRVLSLKTPEMSSGHPVDGCFSSKACEQMEYSEE